MTLNVDPPDPPQIIPPERLDEYEYEGGDESRRVALQEYLNEGAWMEGFSEWAGETDLTNPEFEVIRGQELFERFDFFYDTTAALVEYSAPSLADDWPESISERDTDAPVDLDPADVSPDSITDELSDLGRIVADILDDYYVEWADEEDFGPQYNMRDDSLSEAEYSERDETFE